MVDHPAAPGGMRRADLCADHVPRHQQAGGPLGFSADDPRFVGPLLPEVCGRPLFEPEPSACSFTSSLPFPLLPIFPLPLPHRALSVSLEPMEIRYKTLSLSLCHSPTFHPPSLPRLYLVPAMPNNGPSQCYAMWIANLCRDPTPTPTFLNAACRSPTISPSTANRQRLTSTSRA